eukprot:3421436-Prymnesium_polylepis.1
MRRRRKHATVQRKRNGARNRAEATADAIESAQPCGERRRGRSSDAGRSGAAGVALQRWRLKIAATAGRTQSTQATQAARGAHAGRTRGARGAHAGRTQQGARSRAHAARHTRGTRGAHAGRARGGAFSSLARSRRTSLRHHGWVDESGRGSEAMR